MTRPLPPFPSAWTAERAERMANRSDNEDERPWRRPKRTMTPQQVADKIDEATEILKAENDG